MKLHFQISTWLLLASINHPAPGQEVILRDLTTIRSATIDTFDNDLVRLSTGQQMGWHQVLSGDTRLPDQQLELDRRIKTVGEPLMRLHLRIQNGDWDGAGRIAETFFQSPGFPDGGEQSEDADENAIRMQSKYLIALATFHWRLRQGHRAEAVLPLMLAADWQPAVQQTTLDLAGSRALSDPECRYHFSQMLEPVWFDIEQLEATFPVLVTRTRSTTSPPPGWRLYLASMAIDLGQLDEAQQYLDQPGLDRSEWPAWLTDNLALVTARLAWERGDRTRASGLLQKPEPLALYYRGALVESQQADLSTAILTLIQVAAVSGNRHPVLAAAALHQAAQLSRQRDDDVTAKKLEHELLRAFPDTYHARIQRLPPRQKD